MKVTHVCCGVSIKCHSLSILTAVGHYIVPVYSLGSDNLFLVINNSWYVERLLLETLAQKSCRCNGICLVEQQWWWGNTEFRTSNSCRTSNLYNIFSEGNVAILSEDNFAMQNDAIMKQENKLFRPTHVRNNFWSWFPLEIWEGMLFSIVMHEMWLYFQIISCNSRR